MAIVSQKVVNYLPAPDKKLFVVTLSAANIIMKKLAFMAVVEETYDAGVPANILKGACLNVVTGKFEIPEITDATYKGMVETVDQAKALSASALPLLYENYSEK
jgi:hypothetical protein